jgi:tetratricopeptide (TPR) repeat protein
MSHDGMRRDRNETSVCQKNEFNQLASIQESFRRHTGRPTRKIVMEIQIQLAGVQLGPYSEQQVRQYLSEGLLFPADPAREEGTENWIAVNELLPKPPPPTEILPKPAQAPAPGEVSEGPKRAPGASPGITHLPPKRQGTQKMPLPLGGGALDKRTILIGPISPAGPSPSGRVAVSTATTSPLAPAQQGGLKKASGASLAKALARKTSPLPTKPVVPPSGRLPSPAPAAPDAPPPTRQDVRKTSLAPLARALTATIAPMKSTSAPAAPTLDRPITAPLPTRPVFKPISGTLPPPSDAKALSKKLEKVELPDRAQTPPPPPGLPREAATTKIAPPKTKIAETPAAPAPVEPREEPSAQAAPRRLLPALICACAALALSSVYYVWSPYHAASSLRSALEDGDPAELAAAIDFPSVRASLKEQIHKQIAQSGLPEAATNSPAGSASPTLLSTIDQSIDRYVTPEGISGLVKKSAPPPNQEQAQTVSSEVAAKILLAFNSQPVKKQGLDSFDDFVVDRDVALLHLQFQGMGWKLERVDLQPGLALSAPSGAAAPLVLPMADTYLEQGVALSQKGDWDGAIADFTHVLAIDPQSSAAYSDRGAARQSKGDLDGAIKDYTQALAIDPQMTAAYEGRGNAKAARNDLDGAIADYTQAIHLDPTMAAAYDSRGNARTAKDDLEGAVADYTQAITIDPKLASAYSDRGFARQANGNLDGAISDYTQALALKPNTAVAYYNRGLARQSQGNLEAAIVDYDRALAFDPKIAGAYYNRGNAKNANHDLDGAIADYTQAVALNPKIALAYCNRGLARQAKGDLDGAIADYTQALVIDPKIAIAYYDRGLIKAQKNDLDGAIADSSQALDLDPKNVQAFYDRGFAKLAKGNLDGALSDMKEFCDLDPKDHNADHARLYLWLISKAQNSKTDADQELSDALENRWNSSPDELTSKTAAFLLGRINEAEYLAAAASPDAKTDQGRHCEAWYFAGMKRLLMGDKKAAIDAFHQCVATAQNDYCEYILARAELQSLEPTPPPNPAPAPTPLGIVPAKSP